MMTLDAEHERQHAIVADRLAKFNAVPKRDKRGRKKLGREAWWALTWHMRRSHGSVLRSNAPFLGMTYAEVEAWHARLHAEQAEQHPTFDMGNPQPNPYYCPECGARTDFPTTHCKEGAS